MELTDETDLTDFLDSVDIFLLDQESNNLMHEKGREKSLEDFATPINNKICTKLQIIDANDLDLREQQIVSLFLFLYPRYFRD